MTRYRLASLAAAGSASLLFAALWFQYAWGYAPCSMCIWQRWPHGIAIAIGLLFVITRKRWLLPLGALSVVSSAAIGLYHVGVEQKIFEGPDTCTSGPITGQSVEDLLADILTAPLVRCDEIAWELLGVSMAGWNAIASLAIAGLWIWAWRQPSNSASQ